MKIFFCSFFALYFFVSLSYYFQVFVKIIILVAFNKTLRTNNICIGILCLLCRSHKFPVMTKTHQILVVSNITMAWPDESQLLIGMQPQPQTNFTLPINNTIFASDLLKACVVSSTLHVTLMPPLQPQLWVLLPLGP